jgi:mono/diheme cytochrome c family protein
MIRTGCPAGSLWYDARLSEGAGFMRIRVKTVLLGLLALVVILMLAAITSIGWEVVFGPKARAVTNRTFQPSETRMARGQYLVEGVAACFHCHSEHDLKNPEFPVLEGKKGAGWRIPIPELGSLVAPNITSDKESGIGAWTDDEIARAVQEGVSRDGRALFPMMPYLSFRNWTDEDLASVIVYLRSIPPVRSAMPRTELPFPLSRIVNTIPQPLASHQPAAPRTTPEARGEYLVRYVANCGECHTASDDRGQPLPGLEFGGGARFPDLNTQGANIFSFNITFDPSGIAHYDEALMIQTLHTGRLTGRTLNHVMPFEAYRNLTDDDIRDIFAFLKSRPPVKHRISNTDPPTLCPVCNQQHGLGELNRKGL